MPVPRRYTTDAIVLSRFDLGEADRVLTLITPGIGKLKAIAKGIRRPTSRIGGSLEPFAELQVALARGRTFDVVTQVSVGHAWLNLRDSLESAATAWYLAELADRSLEERHAAEPLYALLRRAYELLDAGMAPDRVARWYEMHLLDELGVRPEVDRCVECDRMLEADDRFRWVPPLGGVLCDRCPGPPHDRAGLDPRSAQAAQGVPTAGRGRAGRAADPAVGRARDRGGAARVHPPGARTRREIPRLPRRDPPHGGPGGQLAMVDSLDAATDDGARALRRLRDRADRLAHDRQPRRPAAGIADLVPVGRRGAPALFDDAGAAQRQHRGPAAGGVQPEVGSDGEDVVTAEGEARIVPDEPPASANPTYLAKYQRMFDAYGWTPEWFAERYSVPIRIRPTRWRL